MKAQPEQRAKDKVPLIDQRHAHRSVTRHAEAGCQMDYLKKRQM